MSIDHAAEAAKIMTRHSEFSEGDTAEVSADIAGLTHAVLALVEQQRLANVISLMQMQEEVDDIREGLGLND